MEVDVDLLEKIQQYFEKELDPTEEKEISKKIEEDPQFQYHVKIYQGMVKGIAAAEKKNQSEEASAEIMSMVDKLVEEDRGKNQWRMMSIAAAGLVLLIGAFWGGRFLTPSSLSVGPQIAQDDSIQQGLPDEEPEIVFGSSGRSIRLTLRHLRQNPTTGEEEEVAGADAINQLVLLKHEAFMPGYRQNEKTLFVYVREPASFRELPIAYLELLKEDGSYASYLEIDGNRFLIHPGPDKQLIGAE